MKLTEKIADLIEDGRRNGIASETIARTIMDMLKREARPEIKPKRGIGMVTQTDLLR